MTSAFLIPVVFPDHTDGPVVGLPFAGHMGTIVVDPQGNATYYEFGNYGPQSAGTPFVITNNPAGVGNIRSIALPDITTDANGQVDPASLEAAMNQLTGSNGIYNGDPGTNNYSGMTFSSPFALSSTQYQSVSGQIGADISGSSSLGQYNILSNNCENWVDSIATAGNVNIGINTMPGNPSNSWYPEAAPNEILAANPNEEGYDYYQENSWHVNDITLVGPSSNIAGLPSWNNVDQLVDQLDGAWLTAMVDAGRAVLAAKYAIILVGQVEANVALQIARGFGASQTKPDPLVIDLTGKGLNLTSLSGSTTEFDYNGSGLEENTAWVGAGTGILVMPNAQGQVTNGTELFGPTSGNGFTDLAALDSNHDGKITSADADWSQLEIWQDTNGNGVADPGELETLAQAGITGISLGYSNENVTLNGNSVVGYSTVTFNNGTTTTADEVDFAADLLDTTVAPNNTMASNIPASIQALPWLKGYGQLFDLEVAMSNDNTLVQDDTALTQVAANNFSGFDAAVDALLYEWAGVTNVNPNSRGGYFDARQLEFLEDFTGINWIHYGGSNPGPYHPYVTASWDELFGSEELALTVQTASFSPYLSGLYYNIAQNQIQGFLNLSSAIAALSAGSPSGETGELFGLNGWINFLELVQANPAVLNDFGGLTTSIAPTFVSGLFGGYWVGSTSLPNFLQADGSESFLYGNGWSGSIAAQSGAQVIDTGSGNVGVSAPDGSKVIFTGSGTDTLNLAGSDNAVTLGSGADTVTFNGTSTGNSVTTGTGADSVVFQNGAGGSVASGSAANTPSNTFVRVDAGDFAFYSLPGSFALAGPSSIAYSSPNYAGQVTLSGNLQFAGDSYENFYDLVFMPAGTAGAYSVGTPAGSSLGTIVVDEAGNDTLTFADTGTGTDYWVANDGTDSAAVQSGKTDIEMAGPQSDYTAAYNGSTSTLTLTDIGDADHTGTKTILLNGGTGQVQFGDGSVIGLGSSYSVTGDAVQYGTSGNDSFYVGGPSSFVDGGAGSDAVMFANGGFLPDGSWIITENAAGQVVLNGIHAGYAGTVTLADIETVEGYQLFSTPAGGGALSLTSANSSTAIVVDGLGTNTVTLGSGATYYWHAGAGTTAATLTQGILYLYFAGPAADYTLAYNGRNILTITNKNGMDGTGTKTLTLAGGSGELVFGDGTIYGIGNTLGQAGEVIQYGSGGNDTFHVSGTSTVFGGAGTDDVMLGADTGSLGSQWVVAETAGGAVQISGAKAGFNATVTLSGVEQVDGLTLLTTPIKGGSLTVGSTYGNTLVYDGAGTNSITFDSSAANDWHAGAGTTTATLESGNTEIYLAGPAGDYTETYDGNNQLVVTNTGNKDGTGTKTLVLQGGSGDLVFGDGTDIGLGTSQSGSSPSQLVQYGGSGTISGPYLAARP